MAQIEDVQMNKILDFDWKGYQEKQKYEEEIYAMRKSENQG